MTRPGKLLFYIGLLSVLLVLGRWLQVEIRIDSCLDRGGRWDRMEQVCKGAAE